MTGPNWLKAAREAFNTLLGDFTATWADSAGGATEGGPIDIPVPDDIPGGGRFLVLIDNPSAVTALTVQPQLQADFPTAGTVYIDNGASFAVAAGSRVVQIVEDLAIGDGGRLSITNDSALGAGEGFTAEVRVYAL